MNNVRVTYPSWASSLKVSGSPTAMVVVGLPWYRISKRTRELRVFSAGRYSIGIGDPDLHNINANFISIIEIKVYIDFLKYKKHKKSRHFNISFHMKTKKIVFLPYSKLTCQHTDINNLPLNYQFHPSQVKQINKCLFATFYEVYSRFRIIESGDF